MPATPATSPSSLQANSLLSPSIAESFSQILHKVINHTNDNDGNPARRGKKPRLIQFTLSQFNELIQKITTITPPTNTSPPTTPALAGSIPSQTHAYYNNAKYEEITCKPLKPSYDGSEDNLMTFLTRLDVRRQNEGWAPATYITIDGKRIDLCIHFAQVDADQAKDAATLRWNSHTIQMDKHTIGHDTCNSRQLAIVLMGSITEALSLIILHRIPRELCNDGTYILWTICNNVHRNNVAFTEHIREKITTASLQQFNNNVEDYIIFIKDNIHMLSSDASNSNEHRGLITYLLRQLKQSSVPLFSDYIRKFHVAFQEGKHKDLSLTELLLSVEDKIRVSKHADEWDTPMFPSNPPWLSTQLLAILMLSMITSIPKSSYSYPRSYLL
jgi:hypothetical protein